MLARDTFRTIVASTPLVSMDLVVRNAAGMVLLGQRVNRPAQGYWFVPGGRILKNESLAAAFTRLTTLELGLAFALQDAQYLGLYDHFYSDSIFGDDVSTHYVVNAFAITLPDDYRQLPDLQHNAYRWFSEAELLSDAAVHRHSQWYFEPSMGIR